MQSKQILGLLVVTVVVAAAAIMMYQGKESGGGERFKAREPFKELAVGSIERIRMDDGTTQLELEKKDAENWGLAQRGGFPIDGERLRRMVISISGIKLVNQLTENPEKYDRLGVGDKPAGGTVVLEGSGGKELAKLVIGESRTSGDDNGMGFSRPVGQYVRIGEEKPVYLTSEPFTISNSVPDWLQRDVIAVAKDELQMVTVDAGSTETYMLKPNAAGTFELDNPVPVGKKVLTARVNQVANALANVRLDDVLTQDDATSLGLKFSTKFQAVALNGLTYTVAGAEKDGQFYVKLSAEANPAYDLTPMDDETTTGTEATEKEPPAEETAAAVNKQHGPWIYQLSKYAFDGFTYTFSELLEEDKEAQATPQPAITPNPGALQPMIMDLPNGG